MSIWQNQICVKIYSRRDLITLPVHLLVDSGRRISTQKTSVKKAESLSNGTFKSPGKDKIGGFI